MSGSYGHGPEVAAALTAWAQDSLAEDLTSAVARLSDAGRRLVLEAVVAELVRGTARRATLIRALATADLLGYVQHQPEAVASVGASA